jgi:hypothetical protein
MYRNMSFYYYIADNLGLGVFETVEQIEHAVGIGDAFNFGNIYKKPFAVRSEWHYSDCRDSVISLIEDDYSIWTAIALMISLHHRISRLNSGIVIKNNTIYNDNITFLINHNTSYRVNKDKDGCTALFIPNREIFPEEISASLLLLNNPKLFTNAKSPLDTIEIILANHEELFEREGKNHSQRIGVLTSFYFYLMYHGVNNHNPYYDGITYRGVAAEVEDHLLRKYFGKFLMFCNIYKIDPANIDLNMRIGELEYKDILKFYIESANKSGW